MKEGWYLAKTKTNEERKACENLENQNFEIFCPVINLKKTEEILFPGYLFIHIDQLARKNYHKIRSTRGVSGIVRFNRVKCQQHEKNPQLASTEYIGPCPIPNGEQIIEQVKEMVVQLEADQLKPKSLKNQFQPGDKVKLNFPLVEHLKATFVKGMGKDRGLVLIEYIERQRSPDGQEQLAQIGSKHLTIPLSQLKKP